MTDCGCYCAPAPLPVPLTGVTPYRGARTHIVTGGQSVVALYGPLQGGRIYNPPTVAEQKIKSYTWMTYTETSPEKGPFNTYDFNRRPTLNSIINATRQVTRLVPGPPEILYVSLVGPAGLKENNTTRAILPGQSFRVPSTANNVWVNAASSGHSFSAFALQPVTQYPPVAYPGTFPPNDVVTKKDTIPSYLFEEFYDDDDLQAFIGSYNRRTQEYVDLFNSINLPIYTSKYGNFLDWVANNLYGITRPTLYSNRRRSIGQLNTFGYNVRLGYNGSQQIGIYSNIALTNDDVFKRILTWYLYRGDGKQITTRWLKRRVARFLFGANGTDFREVSRRISISFGISQIAITIITGRRRVTGGTLFNKFGFNKCTFNQLNTIYISYTTPEFAAIFMEAVQTGAIETPSQYTTTCRIGAVGTTGVD